MIILGVEAIIIVVITLLSMWVVLALYHLPMKVRVVIACIVVLWAAFWVLRLHRTYDYELQQQRLHPPMLHHERPPSQLQGTRFRIVELKGRQ